MATRELKLDDKDIDFILNYINKSNNEKLYNKLIKSRKGITRKSAKAKGMGLQVDIAKKLSELLGTPYTTGDDDNEIKPRTSGCNGTDLILSKNIRESFPFAIECKDHSTLHIPEWIKQAKSNCKDNEYIMVIFHKKELGPEKWVLVDWDGLECLWRNNK